MEEDEENPESEDECDLLKCASLVFHTPIKQMLVMQVTNTYSPNSRQGELMKIILDHHAKKTPTTGTHHPTSGATNPPSTSQRQSSVSNKSSSLHPSQSDHNQTEDFQDLQTDPPFTFDDPDFAPDHQHIPSANPPIYRSSPDDQSLIRSSPPPVSRVGQSDESDLEDITNNKWTDSDGIIEIMKGHKLGTSKSKIGSAVNQRGNSRNRFRIYNESDENQKGWSLIFEAIRLDYIQKGPCPPSDQDESSRLLDDTELRRICYNRYCMIFGKDAVLNARQLEAVPFLY